MIYGATVVVFALALVAHALRLPGFADLVSVPIAPLIVALVLGVIARIVPSMRRGFVKIVPSWVPNPELAVWASGACEAAAVVGLLVPPLRVLTAILLIVFFVAIFPANVEHSRKLAKRGGSVLRTLVPRTILQVVFVALCFWILILELS